jgi:hypothetical protein
MKKLNWKYWTAFGIIAAIIIAAVACHLAQPEVSYAVLELISLGTFVLGGVSSGLIFYQLGKKSK